MPIKKPTNCNFANIHQGEVCILHNTAVFTKIWSSVNHDSFITLRSGGFITRTTAKAMNYAFQEADLDLQVKIKKDRFVLTFPNGDEMTFLDNLVFSYNHYSVNKARSNQAKMEVSHA